MERLRKDVTVCKWYPLAKYKQCCCESIVENRKCRNADPVLLGQNLAACVFWGAEICLFIFQFC